MIYGGLKRHVTYQLWAGIALSIIIFFVSILGRYEKSLSQTVGRLEVVRVNAQKMKQDVAQMESLMRRIDALLPADYNSRSHREIILLALDDIKMAVKGGEITVTNFEDKVGELSLQTNIIMPVNNWTSLVNDVKYLSSKRFPYFRIKNVVVEAKDGSKTTTSALICKIEGSIKMPAERLNR